MLIAETSGDGTFEIVDREKDMIKLGAGVFRSGRLSEAAARTGVETLRKFRMLLDRHKVERTVAVATSAVREARNGREFLSRVEQRTGLRPRIISGQEEARLIHRGVREVIDLSRRRALILDVGGGSVELIVGDARGMHLSASLKLGVLRMRDLLADADPISRESRRRLEQMVREAAGPVLERAREIGFEVVVGTAGTILALGLAVHLRKGHDRWHSPDGRVLRRDDLHRLAEDLSAMDAEDRAQVDWIDSHRCDTIHLGALVLDELLELARADELVLCDASIRHGVLLEQIARGSNGQERTAAGDAPEAAGDIRRRSVLRLLRHCGQAGPHAVRVSDLALQIFDQTRRLHPRGIGAEERVILEYGALLHDVGRHVGFENHEHHGAYIIRHANLRGFSADEVELLALLARYHRKSMPKTRHAEITALSPRQRRAVRVLAGIVRIAEGLDRGHIQTVHRVTCAISPARLRILVRAGADPDLELWAAQRKAALLERLFERRIEIVSEVRRVRT